MEDEVALLKEMASNKKTTVVSGMEFIEGTIGGNNVVIVQCGMGKVNAGICAEVLITKFNATSIINTGCAGSLDNDIDIGDEGQGTDVLKQLPQQTRKRPSRYLPHVLHHLKQA